MDKTDDELLAEAQDRDRRHLEAWALYQEIFSRGHIGPVWSIAAVQVALWHICMGEYGSAEATARMVLDTDRVDPAARRTAAVVWCEARDYQELSVDEAYLRDATEACLAWGDSFFAALGTRMLAWLRLGAGARDAYRELVHRAVELFDLAGEKVAAVGCLETLAKNEAEAGNKEAALIAIDAALARIAAAPLKLGLIGLEEARLLKLRDSIR
jgi:hypothetical protein